MSTWEDQSASNRGFRYASGAAISHMMTPWVKRLLLANGAVFLVVNLLGLVPFGWAVDFLGFSAARLLIHPWSPLTYMFLHGSFFHLFANMLVIFFFGPPLERSWGGREFIRFYLIAGMGGALFSLLLVQLIGTPTVIGASGAVFGLLLAFALKWPNAPIYLWFLFPVKAKYFVGFMAFFSLYASLGGARDGVAHWAHLGGLATGFVYLRHGEAITDRLSGLRNRWRRRRLKTETGGATVTPGRAAKRRDDQERDRLDEVDRILDKIRESGIDALSTKERAFLDDMSRRYGGSG
jgi:membrane associated rhomboid family serine protease